MKWVWLANLVLSLLAVLAPMAHVLELPNKLSLDGELWLAVQQNLYRGWGPFLGGPVEIGALATSLFLALQRRRIGAESWPMLIASVMRALPPDWTSYRMRWEIGHALAALLSVISLAAVIQASKRPRL
jgi:hypothetical protein